MSAGGSFFLGGGGAKIEETCKWNTWRVPCKLNLSEYSLYITRKVNSVEIRKQ